MEFTFQNVPRLLCADLYYRDPSAMANRTYPPPAEPFFEKSKSYNVIQPLPLEALEALQYFANYSSGAWVALQAWGVSC
jgi:hypothetical protein